MPTTYPSLHCKAPLRLALFKREAAKPGWVRPMSWRDVRFATLRSDNAGLSRGLNDNRPIWYGFDVSDYFRSIREAHQIVDRLPRAWFTDIHCDETACGIVARLSHGRFIAGYRWDSNGEHVFYPEIYSDETEAARAADSHAETFADSARDDSERFNRMQDAESAVSDALESLRDTWALRRTGRRDSDDVREALQGLRDARAELETATNEYERG